MNTAKAFISVSALKWPMSRPGRCENRKGARNCLGPQVPHVALDDAVHGVVPDAVHVACVFAILGVLALCGKITAVMITNDGVVGVALAAMLSCWCLEGLSGAPLL